MNELFAKIHQKLCKKIPDWTIENFYLTVLSQGKIKSIKRFAQGETGCSINPFDLSRHILALNGDAYIIAHNHPSGRLDHSFGDMNAVDHFRERIEYPLLGSLILSPIGYQVR